MNPYKSQNAISILCVEDDPLSREFLGRIIAMKFPDVDIHVAENGATGLDLFRDHRQDIVLTDISMPVMDGICMTREIRALEPDTQIIALSAHNDLDCGQEELSMLFDHYLLKPANLKKICGTIDDCIVRITTNSESRRVQEFSS